MANFSIAYKRTKPFEGGYANNPADRGGETYKGIARNFHKNWSGWKVVDAYKKQAGFPKNMDKDLSLEKSVESFYKANFWNAIKGDQIRSQKIANNYYDMAVNAGVAGATKIMQRTLKLKQDGKVTQSLIDEINKRK